MTVKVYVGKSAIDAEPVVVSDSLTVRELLAENNVPVIGGSIVVVDGNNCRDLDETLENLGVKDDSSVVLSQKLSGAHE